MKRLLCGLVLMFFIGVSAITVGATNVALPESFQYRKSHVINGSSGAGTGYQIRIVVWRTEGSDGGENVFVGNNCRSDFGDIKFTGSDGASSLDYWLESYDSAKATFWVKIGDNLNDTSQTVYMYYGNPQLATTSNGLNTFAIFRDFVQDFYTAMGNSSDVFYNGDDPGDYFINASQVNSESVSPCLWFRKWGGKQ